MHAIVLLPIIPVRLNDSETSEMVSQLLYGELVEIVESKERWSKIRNLSDDYHGWVDKKMLTTLTDEAFAEISLKQTFCLKAPFQSVSKVASQPVTIPGGAILRPGFPKFHDNCSLQIETATLYNQKSESGNEVIEIALKYLNTPYLWGGKTIFGIDCSGLVQVALSCCGYQLPRDASQQIEYGREINTLSDSLPGDVVFFKNDNGCIHHVGILISQNEVIHASGWVKGETIDKIGIISKVSGEYTHKIAAIRRIL